MKFAFISPWKIFSLLLAASFEWDAIWECLIIVFLWADRDVMLPYFSHRFHTLRLYFSPIYAHHYIYFYIIVFPKIFNEFRLYGDLYRKYLGQEFTRLFVFWKIKYVSIRFNSIWVILVTKFNRCNQSIDIWKIRDYLAQLLYYIKLNFRNFNELNDLIHRTRNTSDKFRQFQLSSNWKFIINQLNSKPFYFTVPIYRSSFQSIGCWKRMRTIISP